MFGYPDETLSLVFDVKYQTRVTVFHRDIQTPRRELKYDAQRSNNFLTEFEVFGWPMKHCLECLMYPVSVAGLTSWTCGCCEFSHEALDVSPNFRLFLASGNLPGLPRTDRFHQIDNLSVFQNPGRCKTFPLDVSFYLPSSP